LLEHAACVAAAAAAGFCASGVLLNWWYLVLSGTRLQQQISRQQLGWTV
jgi:hypothetical protein